MFQSVSTWHRDLKATGNACEILFFFFFSSGYLSYLITTSKNLCHEKNENIKVLFNLVRKLTKLTMTRNWDTQMRNKTFLCCFQTVEEISSSVCQKVVGSQTFHTSKKRWHEFPSDKQVMNSKHNNHTELEDFSIQWNEWHKPKVLDFFCPVL